MSTEQQEETAVENYLEKNLEQIAKYNKPLADKIANHEIVNSNYRLDYTKCDDLNLYIDNIPVHDDIDAITQAQDIFKKSHRPGHIHVIYGLGLGYLLARFVKEVGSKIIVYEPNLDILRITLGVFDLSDIFANQKIKLVHDKFNVKPAIETMSAKGDQITVYFLPYHGHFHKQEIEEFVNELSLINGLIEIGFKELANKSKLWALSTTKNLEYITKGEELEALRDKFQDKPAVIVSAGPSLNRCIEHIKKYRDKIVVVAVGVALKTLLRNGIKPDFCVIIEIGNSMLNVEGADLSGINFVFPPEVNSGIYDYNYDRHFNYYTENLFTSDWVMDYTQIDCTKYMNRGTVSISALWTAKILGCNPLILTGQDLAYAGGKCYAGDAFFGIHFTVNQETGEFEFHTPNFEEQKKEVIEKYYGTSDPEQMKAILDGYVAQKKAELAKVKGQNGEILPTSGGYALFVKHFEELIPQLYDRTLFNCSTGGAQIDGYENALLEDVLEKYATKKIAVEKVIQKSLNEYEKPANYDYKRNFLDKNIKLLQEYIAVAEKGTSFIRKFHQQMKRTRMMREDVRNICYKAMDAYIYAIKQIYAHNRLIMSLSYQEYLEVEEKMKAFNENRSDEVLLKIIDVLTVFFAQAKTYSEQAIVLLKHTRKVVDEVAASKS